MQWEVEAEEHGFSKSLFAHTMAKAAVGGHQVLWLLSQGGLPPPTREFPPMWGILTFYKLTILHSPSDLITTRRDVQVE